MSRSLILAAAAIGAAGLIAAAPKSAPKMSDDEKAIRASVAAYVAAFNKGDVKGVVANFADDIETIDEDGAVTRGKKAIVADLKAKFAKGPDAKIAIKIEAIRFPKPDVALERGSVVVTKDGEESTGNYSAVHVKNDGKWQVTSVHETVDVPENANENPLEKLSWLVGDWVDEDDDATVRLSYHWINGRHNIVCKYSFSANDEPEVSGVQMLGWDPAERKIRSWVWDSTGARGEGVWTEKEERWVVKYIGTRADGDKLTSINIYALKDRNSYVWKSVDREIAGQLMPDVGPVQVVRDRSRGNHKKLDKDEDED